MAADETEIGAAEAALAHQRADDAAGGGVDRHGQAEPDAGDRGVDADQPARAVDQRAAGVAGVECGVGLDDVLDDARWPTRRAVGSDRPSALTTPAVTEPVRPSGLPTATTSWPTRSRVGVAELGGREDRRRVTRTTARSDSASVPTTS